MIEQKEKNAMWVHHLKLSLAPMPKARARVTGRGTYMPSKYQQWMNKAVNELKSQWPDDSLSSVNHIKIEFEGGTARSDLDNDVGSVFDALTKSGVLKNDNKNVISDFAATWRRGEKDNINIYIFNSIEETK